MVTAYKEVAYLFQDDNKLFGNGGSKITLSEVWMIVKGLEIFV